MGSGTQFLSVPTSAYDLMYFHTVWRNPAALNQIYRAPHIGLASVSYTHLTLPTTPYV